MGWTKEKQLQFPESWSKVKKILAKNRVGKVAWNRGTKLSEKHKENICNSIKQKYVDDPSYKERTTRAMHSPQAIEKMRNTKMGKKLSDEHRAKIKATMKKLGKEGKLSVWSKANLPPNLEFARSKSPIQLREKNINWNPDKQDEYGYEFTLSLKKKILLRDSNKCVNCKTDKKLVIHHIDQNKHNNSDDNLITLCRTCHLKVHHGSIKLIK